MKTTRIIPKDRDHWLQLRSQDVTSTEAAALFGISPYMTVYELYHRKRNADLGEIEENDRMVWGNRLERAIAQGIAEDLSLNVNYLRQYMRLEGMRVGSSFDFEIINHPDGPGLLEIKNVDGLVFRDNWQVNDDGSVEAPPHIELQAQHQMLVSGRKWSIIAALIGGNRVVTLRRQHDPEVGAAILAQCEAFWQMVDEGREPDPDYSRDVDTIRKLHGYIEPDKTIDMTDNEAMTQLCHEYKEAANYEKMATLRKEEAKAKVIQLVGDAAKCKTAIGSVTSYMTKASTFTVTRDPTRVWRINIKDK